MEQELASRDIRGYIDDRAEKIGKKIRDTELKKIPIMLIVGEKEQDENRVSVRRQGEGDVGSMTIGEFRLLIQIRYLPTIGTLRPIPKAFGETRKTGAV